MTGAGPDQHSASARTRNERSLSRLVGFSDGVYAIAITLLALDVRLPAVDATALNPPLAVQLVGLLPNLFAFALSFVVIGGYWVAHHRFFSYVERYDTRMLWLNLLVMFFVALLPFPTQVVADYGDTTLGIEVYAGGMTLTGLAIAALMLYAFRSGLMCDGADMRMSLTKALITPCVFGVSMVVAIWSPTIASSMWWLIAVVYFVIDPIVNSDWRKLGKRRPAGG